MSTTLLSIVRHTRRLNLVRLPRVRRGETTISVREVRRGMRLGLFEAALAQVFLTIAFGTIATGLALLLGARSFELGVLAALPVIGSLLQFPAAWWVERHGHRRRLAVMGRSVASSGSCRCCCCSYHCRRACGWHCFWGHSRLVTCCWQWPTMPGRAG